MSDQPMRVAVLGGGSFGTALASIAADNGAEVRQWLRDPTLAEQINREHVNGRYLPDYAINSAVVASTDMAEVLPGAGLVLVAIPSKAFAKVVRQARPYLSPDQILVSTTKGIQEEGFKLMSQILEEETGFPHIGVISGPNLASEVADKQLTATVVASDDPETRTWVQTALSCDYFRVYASNDRYGVELGGALKNLYAIAAGMAAALGMGENTRSMLMTRALAEMSRFAVARGANPMTFLGLAGVGDLIVTCSSKLSRNYRVGYALGEGRSLDEAVAALGQVAEGVNSVRLVRDKARHEGIYMPLAEGLYQVLFKGVPAKEMARLLMLGEQSSDVEFVLAREDVQRAHREQGGKKEKKKKGKKSEKRVEKKAASMNERLLIMRHGEAAPGRPDAERELTSHGRQEARHMAAWLRGRDDLNGLRLLASPYRRAQQTAALLAEALDAQVETLSLITPDDSPQAVVDWLMEQPPGRPLLLVSHMPLVGALAGLLVEGRAVGGLGFPTAAVAELDAEVWAAGCARLVRLVTPAELA